jgi:hydroxypyruvate reductase
LSDVVGDDLSAIASGPTVADNTTFQEAIAILKQYHVWDKVPVNVSDYLQQGAAGLHLETAKPGDALFQNTTNTLVGSNRLSLEAVLAKAEDLGYQAQIYDNQLSGEARQVASDWVAAAKNLQVSGIKHPLAMIAGGETTVTLIGTGKGGRNQEMALAFALAAEQQGLTGDWSFLSGGTDGRDGPTDAAGGCVDPATLDKIRLAGIAPQSALNNNDAYHALKAADALVVTGATGTNVADLQIMLLNPFTD